MLKDDIKAKNIRRVIHFTRIENLNKILQEGLRPRDELSTGEYIYNDEHRIDGYTNAVCCSICYPNYKMFYKLRMEDPTAEWVIIGIKTKVLWKKDVAFCFDNAASSDIITLPLEVLKGSEAFLKMFEEYDNKPSRHAMGLPDCYPTNPQAEVLVFDTIDPKDIFGLVFETQERKDEYKKRFPDLQMLGNKKYFSARHDYDHW